MKPLLLSVNGPISLLLLATEQLAIRENKWRSHVIHGNPSLSQFSPILKVALITAFAEHIYH